VAAFDSGTVMVATDVPDTRRFGAVVDTAAMGVADRNAECRKVVRLNSIALIDTRRPSSLLGLLDDDDAVEAEDGVVENDEVAVDGRW
jgi:hypothetical protein